MKSVKRTIVRVVTYNKRKRTVTLRPKGTESDYTGYGFPEATQEVSQRVDMVTELLCRDSGGVSSEIIKRHIEAGRA